ncbi:hypothetical protein GCM10009858_02270 [Terrabacter carboxydivorans]|uniref:ArgK protein n=1 Tax=Terrabacter carboxydivorans TaxID=619730 RepID=A0ABN3KPP8_9MICO
MPGGGDEIQIMKAGILEIGNVFVVNKADRDGAQRTQSQLKAMVRLQDRATRPAVLLTRADVDEGVLKVVQHVDAFVTEHQNSGRLDADRQLHLRREALQLIGAHKPAEIPWLRRTKRS